MKFVFMSFLDCGGLAVLVFVVLLVQNVSYVRVIIVYCEMLWVLISSPYASSSVALSTSFRLERFVKIKWFLVIGSDDFIKV